MTDQKRDESKDVRIICREHFPCDDYVGHWYSLSVTEKMLPIAPGDTLDRYVPHSDLVAAEERADDAEYELKRLKSELRGVAANLDRQLHPDDDMMPRGKRIRLSMTGMLDHLEDLLK